MSKHTKKRKEAFAKIEPGKSYSLKEAAALVKEITTTKFDASVDVDVRLGVDPRKANQMVRGVVTLPHGTGKQVRVLALCTPAKEAEAKVAGRRSKSSSPCPLSWERSVLSVASSVLVASCLTPRVVR